MRSRLVALGLVWGCIGTGAVAACGGDDASSGGETPDAAADTSNPPPMDGSTDGAPKIVAGDLVVYTGMTAALDASQTAAQFFQWAVKSAPPGSAVTTATLGGATSARPSFRADVTGEYVLELTAKNGAAAATEDVKVTAVAAPLFYMQTSFSETPAYFEYRTVGTDGTGGHPIACRATGPDPADAGEDDNAAFLGLSLFLADMGEDWWEAPPGSPSRVAFAQFEFDDAGDGKMFLGLGTNASTCQNPPVKVAPVPGDGGGGGTTGLVQPRFSRNGARVAYIEQRSGGWVVATVGYDGNDRRDLARLCPDDLGGEGCFKPAVFPPRPQWLNDQTIGWVRTQTGDAGTGWEVLTANDSANPQPKVYMTCDGVTPRSFVFLKDGSIIANREAPDAGREDLWVLRPSTPGGACQIVRNLTNLPTARSYARDFSVSPDEQQVAFVRRDEPADAGKPDGGEMRFGGQVYTVPVNGASPPAPVTGTAQEALFGPRYVAGASMLAWNGLIADAGTDASLVDGGLPVIAVAPVSGGAVSYAVKSDPDAGTYVVGGGNGGSCDFRLCSMGRAQSTGGGALAFAAIAGALAVRRRRRG